VEQYHLFISLKPFIISQKAHICLEDGMKALILSDEINQFHWTMLKSVLLILSLLPLSQGFLHLWQSTEGSSQIMVGFFALSLMSSCLLLSFWSALQATVLKLEPEQASCFEQAVVKVYRYLPMLSLAAMLSYLVTQL
jgi:hypothetical protein